MKFLKLILWLLFAVVAAFVLRLYFHKTKPVSDMVLIPGGEFTLGSDDLNIFNPKKDEQGINLENFLKSEQPVRRLGLNDFLIDRYEVTNMNYYRFCRGTNHKVPSVWVNNKPPEGRENYPVNNVTWFDASEYCSWVGKRLPKEEEWEKAARGPSGKRYPWGNEFNIENANLNVGDLLPSGGRPKDISEYGVSDMAGNVMEWTVSWYRAYPGSLQESEEFGSLNRVLKGWSGTEAGHFGFPEVFSRSSARHFYLPFGYGDDIGFRCVSTEVNKQAL